MCDQGCGKRVLCGALRSPIDFVVLSDGFVAILASSSCSSSLRILSSCVSLARANHLRSPGRSLRMGFFGDCRCSLSSSLGLVALTSFIFMWVSRKRSSPGGRKVSSCASCFDGHNEGGLAVAHFGLQRRSSPVENSTSANRSQLARCFLLCTFSLRLVSRHNKRWKDPMAITKCKVNLRSTKVKMGQQYSNKNFYKRFT